MHTWCPREVISAWKLRKKWTCAGCRMSMRTRMRSGLAAGRAGDRGAGRGFHRPPRHREHAGAPSRPGELAEVGDAEQHREHHGVGELAALVGAGDQVGDV